MRSINEMCKIKRYLCIMLGTEHKDWFRGPVPPEVKEEGDSRVKGNIIFHA